jgi:hypothetical protein
MRWWSIFWSRPLFFYGYAGDETPDTNSLMGIGNSKYALSPGSLKPYYSAALTIAEAKRRGLTPAVGPNGVEHASGEEFEHNGKTYRWDDTFGGNSSFVDIYSPDRPPDKGVSAAQIAHDRGIMATKNPLFAGAELPTAPPPSAIHVGPSKPPVEAQDLGHAQGPQAEEQPPSGQAPTTQAQAPPEVLPPTPPLAPLASSEPPTNAVQQAPVSQDQIDQIKADAANDPEVQEAEQEKQAQLAAEKSQVRVIDAHSAAVGQNPNDQRVTRRINPDTGSNKIVGSYFVPGDPVHEEILSGMDPAHRAKLPVISQAIQRGGPFSFMYGSAQQEGGPQEWEGERPTAESRAYEQAISPVESRLAGEAPQQAQRVSMLPMQMMVSQGNNPLLEGFVNDAVMNNGAHLLGGAQTAKVPVPYHSMQDPNLHKDVMGFLENQAHGFMGDGTPMVDENGQPHPLHVANQQSPNPYIPHLMQRPQAEFVHAMLNIRQPKNPKPPTKPPGFGERAAWQRRVNQGYAGQPAGFNNLLRQLDAHLPQVGMRNKKGNITRHVPWSEGTLEPTWRAYRPELMSQLGMPPIGAQSMREVGAPEQIVHRAPHFRQTLAQYEPGGGPEPIATDPAIGSYTDQPGEKITHAALRYHNPPRVYTGYNHWHAKEHAVNIAGEDPATEHEEGFLTNQGRFLDREEGWRFARAKNQLVNAGDEPVLHAEQVQGRKLDSWDLPYGSLKGPEPIAGNPEMGAPAGTANPAGTPGLLAGGETETEATSPSTAPEEFGQIPGGGGGMDFASPSVRENMTMNMAKLALKNPKSGHGAYRDFNQRLEQGAAQASGAPEPEIRDAIGSWADGAENSLRLLYGKQDRKTRKLVNAIRGLHSAQKQVLNFHYDDEGPHAIAHMSFHHDNPQYVSDLLDKHGLAFRTLEAPGNGQRAWAHVVVGDPETYDKIEQLVKGGHVHEGYYRNGHADFIGDENGEDREAAAKEYRRIIEEARVQADQGWQGRGKPSGAPRPQEWWEPLAQEADLNYEKLRASDELKRQQLVRDLKAAKADRENITPERAQELAQIQATAQDWVKNNPKLHKLAVHHYLYGNEKVPSGIDPETGKETEPNNEDIATHFEARNPRLDYSNPAHRKKAADALTHDIMRSLATNPSSYGWYDSTVDKALDKISEVAPEIKTDPAHAMAMRLAMAVTSQGQKVIPNFESAYKIYRYWKENKGKFPVMDPEEWKDRFGGGTKRDAMIKNFQKLNDLWDKHGLEGLKKILETPITVGELKSKHDLKVSGEAVDHTLPGAAFMGPKIGIFYSNLNKIFHHTTMDLWFSRNLNRIAGNMFKFSPEALQKGGPEPGGDEDEEEEEGAEAKPSQLERLERAIGKGATGLSKEEHKKMLSEISTLKGAKDLSRLKAMQLAPTLTKYVDERHRTYMKGEGYEGSYPKALATEENRAAKNIDLNFHGLQDAPRTSTERKQWRQIMDQVEGNLKKGGLDINAADRQALLWYLEQGLFQMGGKPKTSFDYLDAAHVLARKVRNGEI